MAIFGDCSQIQSVKPYIVLYIQEPVNNYLLKVILNMTIFLVNEHI